MEEVRNTLLKQSDKKVWRRFMNNQLEFYQPIPSLQKSNSFNQLFLTALYIVFGSVFFSCDPPQDKVAGKILISDTSKTTLKADTLKVSVKGEAEYNEAAKETVECLSDTAKAHSEKKQNKKKWKQEDYRGVDP